MLQWTYVVGFYDPPWLVRNIFEMNQVPGLVFQAHRLRVSLDSRLESNKEEEEEEAGVFLAARRHTVVGFYDPPWLVRNIFEMNQVPETRYPKPETRNTKPETRNTKQESRIPKHETRNTKHETRSTKHETRNTNPESRNTKHETRNTKHERPAVARPKHLRDEPGESGPRRAHNLRGYQIPSPRRGHLLSSHRVFSRRAQTHRLLSCA